MSHGYNVLATAKMCLKSPCTVVWTSYKPILSVYEVLDSHNCAWTFETHFNKIKIVWLAKQLAIGTSTSDSRSLFPWDDAEAAVAVHL